MALFNLCPCSSASHPKHLPLSLTPTFSSLPKISYSLLLSPPLHSPFLCSSFSALVVQSHKPKSIRPTSCNIKSTRPSLFKNKKICCAVNDSSNYGGNRPPRETILLPGCDYEHWLIVMEFPKDPKPSSEEMVDTYIKTLAKVVGSEEEAKKKIYALSTTTYTGFQALISEELSEKCKGLPGVLWVLPDSYIDVPNKDYGGDKFIDGKVIPRPQPRPSERHTKEINEAQKIHILVKMACKEADTEKILIGSEREGDTQKASVVVEQIRKQIMVFTLDLVNAKNLEKELASTTAEVESLKNELNLAKETESKICHDAFHPIEKLKKVIKEIENTNKQESDALSLLKSINFELAKEKGYLKKVIEEGCALRASMDSLKAELERKKIELAELNEIEAQAEAKAADLNYELHRARFKLEAAIAAEAKVKDGASYLSQTIQNLIAEAEEAKKDAESMVEKARKAKVEIEQSKTETVTINSRLEATHTELVEAKAAEAIAVKQINDLSGRANTARASNSEFGAGITISLSEFDALGRKVEEADRLADKKVAAVVAQIDAIKAGEQEISMKLELANQEIEDLKSEQQQELQKAEIATAAKRAIEGELVRWRDHEQQNKATPRRTTSDFLISGKENIPVSFVESKILNSEPLVKELNGNDLSEMQESLWSGSFSSKKKKRQIIPNIRRLFTRNKRVGSSLR